MIQVVIFDLDGTIIDNEGIWEEIFRQVWEEYSGV
jgi:beta-phosphoglucomutase-like phosphatase (HAD superfamily)